MEELKNLEIQLVWHFAAALGIADVQDYKWENMWDLMDKIKKESDLHYTVVKDFLDALESAQIATKNDALAIRAPEIYISEVDWTKKLYIEKAERLISFCKSNRMEDVLRLFDA